jgi:hypothetical protein
MPSSNPSKLYINEGDGTYYCWECERHFNTAGGARSHARSAGIHAGRWCERCDRLFGTPQALESHLANAAIHQSSDDSDDDDDEGYLTESESDAPSEEGEVYSYDRCGRHYDQHRDYGIQNQYNTNRGYSAPSYNPPNQVGSPVPRVEFQLTLKQHRHYEPQSVECYGCYEQFGTLSGALMHLESGACESMTQLHEVDEWAFQARESYKATNRWIDHYKYRCPTCREDFRVFSALILHIERGSCAQRIDGAVRNMLDNIEKKVCE